MTKRTDLRDPRVWPEDQDRWGNARRRRNDRETIVEGLSDTADPPVRLRYRGVNRAGTCVTGSTGAETAGGLAERLYRARWQELTVTDAAGEEIGGIVPASDLYNDTGHRVWWGES